MVSPRYAPDLGGVEEVVGQIAQRCGRYGVVADVLTTDPTRRLPRSERLNGVHVRRFPTLGDDAVYFLSPRLARWLYRNASRYDFIHVHSYHTGLGLAAAAVSRLVGLPYVVTPYYHGTGHSTIRRGLHVAYRPFGHALLRGARAIICNSEAEAAQVVGDVGEALPVTTVPLGIDLDQIRSAPPLPHGDRTVVLAVGRLEPYKQTAKVVAAMEFLPSHFQAVVIGVGPARSELESLIAERRLADRVQLLGSVSREMLSSWYRSADVAVSLSLQESFGLTLAEAGGAGATVVASDIPAHREVARMLPSDRIVLIPPASSPEAAARAIDTAAARATRGEVVPSVRTWEDTVRATVDVYREVAAPNRGPGRLA
jgi:glycosyltransferase involved in cell wall biosynthesis